MRELVLAPLAMRHSTFEAPLSPSKAATAASAYDEGGTSGTAPASFVEPNASAGGLWTTATDYAKFVVELQKEYAGESNRVLDQKIAQFMVTAGLGPSENIRRGLGVRVGGTQPHIYFEHGGACSLSMRHGWVFLGRRSGRADQRWRERFALRPACPQCCASVQVAGFSTGGAYRRTRGTIEIQPIRWDLRFIKVTQDGSHLMVEIPLGSKAQELFPESDTQYFLSDDPTSVIFDLNPDGSVAGWSSSLPMFIGTGKNP